MAYPSVILENQFGEVSNNAIKGGSSQIRAKFTVASTDAAGLGITGLVSQGIDSIFMHTSQTPGTGNPNPASGYILAKLSDGFTSFQSVSSTIIPPQSGASLLVASAGLTAGLVYVITILGTTSQAQWEVLGVPHGVTAALGVAFVAIATSCTGTGAVQVPATGGAAIVSIQPLGNPSVSSVADGSAGYVTLACYQAGGTFTGSALPTHNHNLIVKGGQAASTTNNIANYAGPLLGKQEATDATYIGANSATSGGVIGISAGTPAGTIAGSIAVGAPADGTIIDLCFNMIPLPASLI